MSAATTISRDVLEGVIAFAVTSTVITSADVLSMLNDICIDLTIRPQDLPSSLAELYQRCHLLESNHIVDKRCVIDALNHFR